MRSELVVRFGVSSLANIWGIARMLPTSMNAGELGSQLLLLVKERLRAHAEGGYRQLTTILPAFARNWSGL
jgi:hypothetical protein